MKSEGPPRCTSLQSGNERRQSMSKHVHFTGAHFPDLNPNSYGNLSNMKLDLNISANVIFSANDKSLKFKNQVNYRFLLRVFLCMF